MSDTFDRSQLDGKDREQLSEIASALGVKAISRMRKADLVDAIVTAAAAGNGGSSSENGTATSERPRRIRSTKPATDDLAALAAEQEALDAAGRECRARRHGADPPAPPQRCRQRTARTVHGEHGDLHHLAHRRGRDHRRRRLRPRTAPTLTLTCDRDRHRASVIDAAAEPRPGSVARRRQHAGQPPPAPPSWPRPRRSAGRPPRRAHGPHGERARRARTQRRSPGRLLRRPHRHRRSARPARRGLRLPPRRRLPPRSQRRVRVGVPGAPLRSAQGRPRAGRDPPAREQREVPGARARRPRQRDVDRRSARPCALRGPHAAVPGLAAAPRARRRSRRDHRPHHRPHLADRKGPARPDRLAAEGRQDDDHQADRVLDRTQQPRDARHGAARRRAPRRGHRHAPARAARRSHRVDVRPSLGRALPRRRARDRAGTPPRRDGQRRRHHPRRHHPPGPGLQPRRAGVRPHHVGWCRLVRALPAEEVLRCGAEYRRGWIVDDPRDRAHRHRLEDGRSDLRGVQGHRQHGTAPRPARRRPSDLSRRSTSSSRAPGTKSCSSTGAISSRPGSCAGC